MRGQKEETAQAEEKKTALGPDQIDEEGITGVYNGARTVKTQYGEKLIHDIGGIELWGSKDLDTKLAMKEEGEEVTVSYEGKVSKKTKDGKKYSMHTFNVE